MIRLNLLSHSQFISIFSIILYIDDELSDSSRIVSGSSRISVSGGGAEEGGLYFGGVPPEIDIGGRAASTIPFQGCISDIIINNQ